MFPDIDLDCSQQTHRIRQPVRGAREMDRARVSTGKKTVDHAKHRRMEFPTRFGNQQIPMCELTVSVLSSPPLGVQTSAIKTHPCWAMRRRHGGRLLIWGQLFAV